MASSFSVPCPKTTTTTTTTSFNRISSLHGSTAKSSLSLVKPSSSSLAFQKHEGKQFGIWKLQAQRNEVTAKASSNNSAPVLDIKPEVAPLKEKDESPEELFGQDTVPDTSAISAFMTQVADLVKLVDSRDIVELQLKQQGCELLIRKKEALPQPPAPAPAPFIMHHSPPPSAATPPAPPAPAAAPPAATPPPAPTASSPPSAASSSHPPFKCPMAGTFYRSPGPGEPPFVKVGDQVQKGQVLCIVEAMKLMNEIEADKSGKIVEVLLEDGKPVSVGTPLFVIAP
uniref:Biotin carboxyl carrier protein of acetyl-CoA carboxylase n=1 Tax=Hypseocharis bilobata TaxID=253189 RepID=A0A286SC31_9ROSI|nr:biotin carboxyl carrier protein subunit [Hypseocharis bilobata]